MLLLLLPRTHRSPSSLPLSLSRPPPPLLFRSNLDCLSSSLALQPNVQWDSLAVGRGGRAVGDFGFLNSPLSREPLQFNSLSADVGLDAAKQEPGILFLQKGLRAG